MSNRYPTPLYHVTVKSCGFTFDGHFYEDSLLSFYEGDSLAVFLASDKKHLEVCTGTEFTCVVSFPLQSGASLL